MSTSPVLSPEQADTVLKADVANVVRKAREGKTLSAAERALIKTAAEASPGEVYDSIDAAVAALRQLFGPAVNKRLLQKLKAEPGSAKAFRGSRVYLADLTPYLEAKLAAPKAKAVPDKYLLECEKLKEQIEGIRFNNARAGDLYWLRAEVEQWMVDRQARIKLILRKKLKSELPPKLVGLTAPQIAAKMDDLIFSIVDQIRK